MIHSDSVGNIKLGKFFGFLIQWTCSDSMGNILRVGDTFAVEKSSPLSYLVKLTKSSARVWFCQECATQKSVCDNKKTHLTTFYKFFFVQLQNKFVILLKACTFMWMTYGDTKKLPEAITCWLAQQLVAFHIVCFAFISLAEDSDFISTPVWNFRLFARHLFARKLNNPVLLFWQGADRKTALLSHCRKSSMRGCVNGSYLRWQKVISRLPETETLVCVSYSSFRVQHLTYRRFRVIVTRATWASAGTNS